MNFIRGLYMEMLELIEEYFSNLEKREKLLIKLARLKEYDTKITASYSSTGGGKGSVTSKVERHVVKILEIEQKIREVENDLYIIDKAQKVLTNKENEVIELVKIHKRKLSRIAKTIQQSKKYVFDTRNRAIKKMCEYIEKKTV